MKTLMAKILKNPRHEVRERIYHHFGNLEEYHSGMWRIVRGEERKGFIFAAAALMRDAPKFKACMQRAIEEWTNSCEHNLTAENVNRIAWLGHAGCCIGANSPEEATRAGWHTLNKREQDEANRVAGEVLDAWDASTSNPSLFQWMETNA
jgi:hypothetical protein